MIAGATKSQSFNESWRIIRRNLVTGSKVTKIYTFLNNKKSRIESWSNKLKEDLHSGFNDTPATEYGLEMKAVKEMFLVIDEELP